jgi:hypothetical protein
MSVWSLSPNPDAPSATLTGICDAPLKRERAERTYQRLTSIL